MNKNMLASALAACVYAAGAAQADAASPADAARDEYQAALKLTPNIDHGRQVYMICAVCHRPEGWGTRDGTYPQIAGQLYTVIVKQLADIRARNRNNPMMYPFALPRIAGGTQSLVDVAAYIATLPMTPNNGIGPGTDLALGKRLFHDNCTACHGKHGEGDLEGHVPAIWGQHFGYLMREFRWIKIGRRINADPKMRRQIRNFSPRDMEAVLDYVSRLRPPASKLAGTADWENPDFPNYIRPPMPEPPPY